VQQLFLGSHLYNQDELLDILDERVAGNGLIALAHQLIGTKLNIANGAPHNCIDATVMASDQIIHRLIIPPIGNGFLPPEDVQLLVMMLERYNLGQSGCAPPCPLEQPPYPDPWIP
jgi:hypothetical protein